MRNELIDLYKLACANPQDKDIARAYQSARDRIGPQIAIHGALDNDALRARLANWQDDINAVLKQRDDLHFRVARLEEALKKIADGRGTIPDSSTIFMNGKVPEIPKYFNKYDMQEIARRALEEK